MPNLDLLRSAAVGLVFIEHFFVTLKIRGLTGLGHFGVLLFFVHTSLVLMLSMDRLGLSGSSLYIAFATRRVFRIYPLSILAVLAAVVFHIPSTSWSGGYVWKGWSSLISNTLLIQNITHSGSVNCVLWSLSFELQMYALLPAIYLLMRRFPSLRTASLLWMMGIAAASLEYLVRNGSDELDYLLARYLPCFLAGVLAWWFVARRPGKLPGSLWVVVLIFIIVAYRIVVLIRNYGPDLFAALHGAYRNDHGTWWPPSPYRDLINDWMFCSITGLAIPLFANITNRWLNSQTKRIAQYSYGIYICHVPILWLCFVRLQIDSVAVRAILCILLVSLVSIALYHWIEDPAIRYGKLLATQMGRRATRAGIMA